jgi:AcrR family transcriptional regulator
MEATNTLKTTKKRQIELREARLLETAGTILLKEGLAELTMERLAAELETAKGTIYNHFPNREEVLLTLAVKAINKRLSLFDTASLSHGNPKQRMLAVNVACEIYVVHYPQYFMVENIVRHSAIWDRGSEDRRNLLRSEEGRCMTLVSGIVRAAIADGDLKLPEGISPEEMALSLWSLTYGSYLLNITSPSLKEIGIHDVHRAVRIGCQKTVDGYGWLPLWTEEEHAQKFIEIRKTIFPQEKGLSHE